MLTLLDSDMVVEAGQGFVRAHDYGKCGRHGQGKHCFQIKYLECIAVARVPAMAHNAGMVDVTPDPSVSPYPLAVIMERVQLDDRWATDKWEPKGIVPDTSPPGSTERVLLDDGKTTRVLFPGMTLRLVTIEAEGYLLNLTSPEPRVFVLWRLEDGIARPERLTVSYNEGTRWADSEESVDSVPLPADLVPWIAEYAAAHYRPEPKKKPRYASSKDKGVGARRQG